LLRGPHAVVAVVTQPDRPRGRGRRPSPSPVAEAAARAGVACLKPEAARDPAFVAELRKRASDLGVVVAYGQFLPRSVREAPSLGYCINAHASLLPKFRGAAPVTHAILAGETETGVSVMRVEREMDAGPLAAVVTTAIGAEENAGELGARLAVLAAGAIVETIDAIARDEVRWTPQQHAAASFAPKLAACDAELDWRRPAAELVRRVRAFAPRPGAATHWGGERLRILAARALDDGVELAPGTVRGEDRRGIRVATGRGWLAPLVLQRAGARALDVESFLRGHPIPDGARFGS
jgi:methionyl-tRNA formyltransferase